MRAFDPRSVPKPKQFIEIDAKHVWDLEVGCGVGKFAISYLQEYPDRHLIALDRSRSRIQKLKQTVSGIKQGLEHLKIICEDFDKAWVHALSTLKIQRIFFWYPNPYPKPSQANKRWHRMSIMGDVLRCLMPKGEIYLATNEAFYAQEAQEYLLNHWGLHMKQKHLYQHVLPFEPRTHFEKKYLERGECIYDFVFKKQALKPS